MITIESAAGEAMVQDIDDATYVPPACLPASQPANAGGMSWKETLCKFTHSLLDFLKDYLVLTTTLMTMRAIMTVI